MVYSIKIIVSMDFCLGYKDKSSKEKDIMRRKEEDFIFSVSRETTFSNRPFLFHVKQSQTKEIQMFIA